MSIPSDFDPLAWGERRYIQPVLKRGSSGYNAVTDNSYPYSFKMEANGTYDYINGGPQVYLAFDGKGTLGNNYGWGGYSGSSKNPPQLSYYCLMTFEYPLKIVGVQFFSGLNA